MFIGVLKGSFVFMADLVRAIDLPCQLEFLGVSSYGSKSETTGAVRITRDLEVDIEGRFGGCCFPRERVGRCL